jgi:hypothetical protein
LRKRVVEERRRVLDRVGGAIWVMVTRRMRRVIAEAAARLLARPAADRVVFILLRRS